MFFNDFQFFSILSGPYLESYRFAVGHCSRFWRKVLTSELEGAMGSGKKEKKHKNLSCKSDLLVAE